MPSFDFSSEVEMVALKNAIDAAGKKIIGRHDFKGTSAKVELNEKDKTLMLFADSDFQLNQVKDLLFPELEKKEPDCVKRLDQQAVQKVSGAKRDVLQETITLVKKSVPDFPIKYGNFRD